MPLEITPIYQDRAILTFDPEAHTYRVSVPSLTLSEIEQPSVTTILGMLDKSAALIPWAVRCVRDRLFELCSKAKQPLDSWTLAMQINKASESWREVRDMAAVTGSVVHAHLEHTLLGLNPPLPTTESAGVSERQLDDILNAIRAGQRFINEHRIRIEQVEAPRWSPTYGYIGTGDLVAEIDGELCFADWKTTKRIYSTVWLQLAAYQKAYQEEFPDSAIVRRVAVNTGRDGKLTLASRDNETLDADFKAFLALAAAYRWDCENGYPRKPAPIIVGPLPTTPYGELIFGINSVLSTGYGVAAKNLQPPPDDLTDALPHNSVRVQA